LGVTPRWTLERAVQRTMAWYRGLAQGQPAMSLCHADIDAFEAAALEAGTV
jgi:CDP-glucose 4,6-dehydratase